MRLAVGLLFGAVTQFVLIRPVQNKSPLNAVILTFGLLILLEGIAGAIWGSQPRTYPAPFSEAGQKLGSTQIAFSPFDVYILVSVLVLMGVMLVLFRATNLGLRMRAVAFAPEAGAPARRAGAAAAHPRVGAGGGGRGLWRRSSSCRPPRSPPTSWT